MTRQAHTQGTILVVDYDEDVCTTTHEILAEAGFRVISAPTVAELLDKPCGPNPVMLLLDTGRRLLDVLPSLRLLRQAGWTDIPIKLITTTSHPRLDDVWELQSAIIGLNVQGVITKPFIHINLLVEQVCGAEASNGLPASHHSRHSPSQEQQRPHAYSHAAHKRRVGLRPTRGQRPHAQRYSPTATTVRWHLTLALVVLVGLSGLAALVTTNGMAVFEKVLPALMFAAGYFFNRE